VLKQLKRKTVQAVIIGVLKKIHCQMTEKPQMMQMNQKIRHQKNWSEQVDEAEKQMTLDEYKKQQEQKKKQNAIQLPEFNIRQAGEGEDPKVWQQPKHVYRKKQTSDEEGEDDEEDVEEEEGENEDEEEEATTGKKKLLNIPLKFNTDIQRGTAYRGRGTRGGRPFDRDNQQRDRGYNNRGPRDYDQNENRRYHGGDNRQQNQSQTPQGDEQTASTGGGADSTQQPQVSQQQPNDEQSSDQQMQQSSSQQSYHRGGGANYENYGRGRGRRDDYQQRDRDYNYNPRGRGSNYRGQSARGNRTGNPNTPRIDSADDFPQLQQQTPTQPATTTPTPATATTAAH